MDKRYKKLAIFIDTNFFCKSGSKGKYLPIPQTMFQIIDLINQYSDNITFLTTQIFKTEIENKIKNLISIEEVAKVFLDYISFNDNDEQDEITQKIIKYNKYYGEAIQKFIKKCQLIDTTLNTDEVQFCCDRAYARQPPFAKKENSWKDCLNLVYIKKWAEINKEEYEVWFVSRDKDWEGIEKGEFGIDFITGLEDLKALNQRIDAYLKRYDVRYALIYSIYEIEDEIVKEIESNMLSDFPSLDDISVCIYSINIANISEEDKESGNAQFEMHCSISGVDLKNARYDKEDRKYYNTEDFSGEYFVEMSCEFIIVENDCSQMTIQNLELKMIDLIQGY